MSSGSRGNFAQLTESKVLRIVDDHGFAHRVLGHLQEVLEYGPTRDFRQLFNTSPLAEQVGNNKTLRQESS